MAEKINLEKRKQLMTLLKWCGGLFVTSLAINNLSASNSNMIKYLPIKTDKKKHKFIEDKDGNIIGMIKNKVRYNYVNEKWVRI